MQACGEKVIRGEHPTTAGASAADGARKAVDSGAARMKLPDRVYLTLS
jgi:hypothetical protein